MTSNVDVILGGGGILGLAAAHLAGTAEQLIEKESSLAQHQTGHNAE